MRTSTRLGLYGLALVVVFAATYAVAGAVVSDDAADEWTSDRTDEHADEGGHGADQAPEDEGHAEDGGHEEPDDAESATSTETPPGLSVAQDGYLLGPVSAPTSVGRDGTLSFALTAPDGRPLTEYETSHEKQLHFVVVRTDGTGFRHVHPTTDGNGNWSMPWRWDRAGSYRLYADFVPTATGEEVTLTRTVEVAGPLDVAPERTESTTFATDGFTVTVDGDLTVGAEETLTFTVTRDGAPVTALQPYLGAYGHLVALRDGDLAYLHAHPMGEPGDGVTAPGPRIEVMVEAPTPGRYLLYLDFQVDGVVHTAEFTVTAH